MKSMSLNIRLEDNEVFQEEVRKVFEATAKQVAREKFDVTLSKEIQRLITKTLKDMKPSYSFLNRRLTDLILAKLSTEIEIDYTLIDKKIEDTVNAYVDKKISEAGSVTALIEKRLDAKLADILLERLEKK